MLGLGKSVGNQDKETRTLTSWGQRHGTLSFHRRAKPQTPKPGRSGLVDGEPGAQLASLGGISSVHARHLRDHLQEAGHLDLSLCVSARRCPRQRIGMSRPVAKCYCEDRSASIVAPTILSWRLGSQRSTPNNQIITYKSRHIYLLISITRTRRKRIQLLEVPMTPILIAHASSQNSRSSTSYSPLLAVSDFQLCDTMHTRILLSRPLYSHTGASVAAH